MPAHTPPRPHVHSMAPPSRPHHGELSRPLHLRDPKPCHHTHDHGHRSDARTHRPKARPWPCWRSCTKQCHDEPNAHSVRALRLFGQAPLGTVASCSPEPSPHLPGLVVSTASHRSRSALPRGHTRGHAHQRCHASLGAPPPVAHDRDHLHSCTLHLNSRSLRHCLARPLLNSYGCHNRNVHACSEDTIA